MGPGLGGRQSPLPSQACPSPRPLGYLGSWLEGGPLPGEPPRLLFEGPGFWKCWSFLGPTCRGLSLWVMAPGCSWASGLTVAALSFWTGQLLLGSIRGSNGVRERFLKQSCFLILSVRDNPLGQPVSPPRKGCRVVLQVPTQLGKALTLIACLKERHNLDIFFNKLVVQTRLDVP